MQCKQAFLSFLQCVFDTSIHCKSCPKLPDNAYVLIQNSQDADVIIHDMFVRFLSDNDNLNGINTLSYTSMSKQPLETPWFPLYIYEILASACSVPSSYAQLWRQLIAVCHTVTPSATQFSAQLSEIDRQMNSLACTGKQQTNSQANVSLGDILSQVLQPIQSIMQQDVTELNPHVLVTTISSAIQQLVDSLNDGDYKIGVQQVLQGLTTLSQKSSSNGTASTNQ